MLMPIASTTKHIYDFALKKLKEEREAIETKILDVEKFLYGKARKVLDTPSSDEAPLKKARKKRKLSAAAKKRISEAQSKRWKAYAAAKERADTPVKATAKKTATSKKSVKKAIKKAAKMATKKTADSEVPF